MCNGSKPSVQPKPPYTPPRRRCRFRRPDYSREAAADRPPKDLAGSLAGWKIWLPNLKRVISDQSSLQAGERAHELEQPAGLLVKPVMPIASNMVVADISAASFAHGKYLVVNLCALRERRGMQPGIGQNNGNMADQSAGLVDAQPIIVVHNIVEALVERPDLLRDFRGPESGGSAHAALVH